jgi:hypothetical protein
MKRTGSYQTRSVFPVRLYLEDYDRLIELIGQDHRAVMVVADKWQLESPDEIEKVKQAFVHGLEVTSFVSVEVMPSRRTLPHLSVIITGPNAHVSFLNAQGGTEGVALQILELLQSRRSKQEIFKFIGIFIPLLPTPIILIRAFMYPENAGSRVLADGLTFIGSILLFVILGMWCYWWQSGKAEKSPALILKRRSEETSFWSRKKDDLLKDAIIAIFGALIGGLIMAAFKR